MLANEQPTAERVSIQRHKMTGLQGMATKSRHLGYYHS
jgi:hypothetical protein